MVYTPPTDELMSVPPAHMYHVPCADSAQRRVFLSSLERSFRACEVAANPLRRPENRVYRRELMTASERRRFSQRRPLVECIDWDETRRHIAAKSGGK